MKGLIILADGFEDVEAIGTIDILRRSGIEIKTCAISSINIVTSHNIKIEADCLLKDLEEEYDFLVIPGGRAVSTILDKSKEIDELIKEFAKKNKLIAAICAAPSLVGKLGYLKNKEFTCFPGFEDKVIDGKYSSNKGVVVSGNFITSKAMGYTNDFALSIVEFLQGKKQREKIANSIIGK